MVLKEARRLFILFENTCDDIVQVVFCSFQTAINNKSPFLGIPVQLVFCDDNAESEHLYKIFNRDSCSLIQYWVVAILPEVFIFVHPNLRLSLHSKLQ